jgi:hypothetical protein
MLSPILLALSPTATRFLCENQALADALALNNSGQNDLPLRSPFIEAISGLRPELETRKQGRARHLRSLLPKTNVFERATDDEAIALATSVYECSDCRLSASGHHMLAHACDRAQKLGTFHPQLSEQGRETVTMLLQLLGLGRETTTLDLDRRNDRFVCMRCSRGSFIQNGKEVLGRCVRDWRSCVRMILLLGQVKCDVDVCVNGRLFMRLARRMNAGTRAVPNGTWLGKQRRQARAGESPRWPTHMGACIVRHESISVGALFNGTRKSARLESMSRKSELPSLDLADKI